MVGELHSLTDWHVSEASDDAELEDFYSNNNNKKSLFIQSCEHSVCVCVCVCAKLDYFYSKDKLNSQ